MSWGGVPSPAAPPSSLRRRTPFGRLAAALLLATLLGACAAVPLLWQRWLAPPWGEVTAQAAPGCDLQRSACRATFEDGSALELALAPRPVPSNQPIALRLRPLGFEPRTVSMDLNGETMNMGPNHVDLAPGPDGRWIGSTSLTACITGRMAWILVVRAPVGGGERVARFRFETGG